MAVNTYIEKVLDEVRQRDKNQPEFCQAAEEVLLSLSPVIDAHPEFQDAALLERLTEPERQIAFRVTWEDDQGKVHVNRGYRIQFNSAIGPYKGGIRFHPTVTPSVLKFLGFEQCFKNALTGLPMGGGKGGADFNPRGRSEREIMRFCQAFMTELYRHIGQFTDIPAGDIGVGAREVGYMYGQYRRIVNQSGLGVLTGKGIPYGGSLGRTEATGYGVCYFAREMLREKGESFEDMKVCISGAGNLAVHAAEKAEALGAKVLTLSDSDGFVYDPDGIDVEYVKELKFVRRGRISEYTKDHPNATYRAGEKPWSVPCDLAIPGATQNELTLEDAKNLHKNGCRYLVEGANMPSTLDATEYLIKNGIFFAPGKAANAGGVSVSGLEMTQNSMRLSWGFDEVDAKLQTIMQSIYHSAKQAAERYTGDKENLLSGANIAGFLRVAEAMMAQGLN